MRTGCSETVLSRREGAARRRPLPRSILARQQDRLVAVIEADLVERKIRERNPLRIDNVAVAVIASERRRPVVVYLQRPELKLLAGDVLVVTLRQRDYVQKPIGSGLVGDILCPVGEQHIAHDAVPVPLLAARELPHVS